MTTFNELVADLVNENLLDESIAFSPPKTEILTISEYPDSIELLKTTTPDFLELAEKHELRLPDFSFLEPENVTQVIDEQRVKAILPETVPQTSFHSTQNFLHYQNRRRKVKPLKKGTKFCRSCALYMPFYYLNCRYCHGKLVGDLFYYIMVMFSAVLITILVLFMLSSKTYN
jgi:hypothetical protein